MNGGLSKGWQSVVRVALPRAAREHVLGDLQERFEENGSTARYVLDAAGILPYVIWGQAGRNRSWRQTAVELVALEASFVLAAARLTHGFHGGVSGLLPALIGGVLIALAALAFGDAYVEPRDRAWLHLLRQFALAYGSVWLASWALSGLAPWLAAAHDLALEGAKSGFPLLVTSWLVLAASRQKSEPATLAEVRAAAVRFERVVRQRNLAEYAAMVLVVTASVAGFFRTPTPWMRAGLGSMAAGALVVGYGLHRRARSRAVPAELAACVSFYRSELARQRDALRGVHRWYLGPMAPALTIFTAGNAARDGSPWKALAIAAGMAGFGLAIVWANRRAAGSLQKKIDGLEELEKQS